jgi:hypothetical protein
MNDPSLVGALLANAVQTRMRISCAAHTVRGRANVLKDQPAAIGLIEGWARPVG